MISGKGVSVTPSTRKLCKRLICQFTNGVNIDAKVKAIFHALTTAEKSLEVVCTWLKRRGFLFAEEDKTFDIRYEEDKVRTILISSQFWSRKDLAEEGPANYSLVIQGETRQESGGGSIIELELIEYHGNHPHRLGGKSIEKYVNELSRTLIVQ